MDDIKDEFPLGDDRFKNKGFSAKLFEIVLYPESFDVSTLDNLLLLPAIKDYAYILHDKDNKKEHIHVFIRTKDSCQSVYVAKWFNVALNLIARVKGRFCDALKYLTHSNAKEKYQYDIDEVHSNFDFVNEIAMGQAEKTIDCIINQIAIGIIREYNYTQYIDDVDYIRFKRQINDAFAYRKDKIRGVKREMDAIFITGDSGTGKTTYAKYLCEQKKMSVFVSSGSNDILDGYLGEDCIILDDLRPSCLGLSDLLKMLDNHTASTIKSRYKNKVLECKLIIITSILPIDTFFKNVFSEEVETIIQLKRRCETYITMDKKHLKIQVFDRSLNDYDFPFTAVNPIFSMFEKIRLTPAQQELKLKMLLGDIVLTPANDFELAIRYEQQKITNK